MVVVSYPISLGAKMPWCKAGLAQRYINQKYNMEVQDQEFVNEPWLHESKQSKRRRGVDVRDVLNSGNGVSI